MAIQEISTEGREARFLATWGGELGVWLWVAGLACGVAALNWFSTSQGLGEAGPDSVGMAIHAASRAEAYGLCAIILIIAGCYLRPPLPRR